MDRPSPVTRAALMPLSSVCAETTALAWGMRLDDAFGVHGWAGGKSADAAENVLHTAEALKTVARERRQGLSNAERNRPAGPVQGGLHTACRGGSATAQYYVPKRRQRRSVADLGRSGQITARGPGVRDHRGDQAGGSCSAAGGSQHHEWNNGVGGGFLPLQLSRHYFA